MKRDATELSLPSSGDHGDSSEPLQEAKRVPPAQQLRKSWVVDSPKGLDMAAQQQPLKFHPTESSTTSKRPSL